jgi:hypothetical protein
MNRNELLALVKNGLNPTASVNFADSNSAAINAILTELNIGPEATVRDIRHKKQAFFALVEEAIDEILPARLTNVMGAFAEIMNFPYDAEVVFKTANVGERRARLTITKGARAGIYRAARLDAKVMQLPTEVYTVSVYVTLEDIITGRYSLAQLFNNVVGGFEEIVYREIVVALRAAATKAPEANRFTDTGYEAADLDAAIRVAGAYGRPVIFGFKRFLDLIDNKKVIPSATQNIPEQDLIDIRNVGYVTLYHGVPVVEIPNYFLDENNNSFEFKESDLFVIPSDARPVKVAFKGDTIMVDHVEPAGGERWNISKEMGVGILAFNNFCIITNTEITGGAY